MQTYGKKKRIYTIHDPDKCGICGEQDLSKSAKHRARQAAKKEIEAEIAQLEDEIFQYQCVEPEACHKEIMERVNKVEELKNQL